MIKVLTLIYSGSFISGLIPTLIKFVYFSKSILRNIRFDLVYLYFLALLFFDLNLHSIVNVFNILLFVFVFKDLIPKSISSNKENISVETLQKKLDFFYIVSSILIIAQKIILFRSDFSGGFSDSINSSATFALFAIFILYKILILNKNSSIAEIVFLILGTFMSEAKLIIFMIFPLSIYFVFKSRFTKSIFSKIVVLILLISIIFASSQIDKIISWSNNTQSNYVSNFISFESKLFPKLNDDKYYMNLVLNGESEYYRWNRINTVRYFFEFSETNQLLFGHQIGAISKSTFGEGLLFKESFFRTTLTNILFGYGLFGLAFVLYVIYKYYGLKTMLYLFVSISYTSSFFSAVFLIWIYSFCNIFLLKKSN